MHLSITRSRGAALLAFVASVWMLVGGCQTGCGGGEVEEGVFRYALQGTPETLDTAKMSGAPEGRVAFNVFEGLLMPAQTTEGAETTEDLVRPGIAKSWEISEDRTTYTFHLREDAKWSNGEPVTAEDFVYAWKRVLTPGFDADYAQFMWVIKNGEAYRKGEIDDFDKVGLEVVDPHTLKVTLEQPTPYFLELVAFYTFFPQPKEVVEEHGERWIRAENIVSNGAYTLEEVSAQEIVLKKNPNYWDADNVSIEKAKLRIIKDKNAIINAFRAGKLHWTGTGLPIAQISSLVMRSDYVLEPMLGTYYFKVNVTDPDSPLANPKVREALRLAINRRTIAKLTMKGLYKPADSFVPSNMGGYTSKTDLEYNLERARKLLAEAGYPNGEGFPKLTLLYNTDKNHKLVAAKIQNMWDVTLGVDIELINTEWKTYLDMVDNLNYDIARAGWIGDYNDPMTFLGMWETGNGNNDTGWSNETYDRLLDKARKEADPEKREKILQRAEKLLLDKGPVIPIYEYSSSMLLSPKVKGFKPHNRNIHLLKDIRLE